MARGRQSVGMLKCLYLAHVLDVEEGNLITHTNDPRILSAPQTHEPVLRIRNGLARAHPAETTSPKPSKKKSRVSSSKGSGPSRLTEQSVGDTMTETQRTFIDNFVTKIPNLGGPVGAHGVPP